MLKVLDLDKKTTKDYILAAYNNLGATNTLLGKYQEALRYYNLAESQISETTPDLRSLADIYINKGLIYTSQKSYSEAIEFLEKGIRLYLDFKHPDKNLFQRLSTAYLNIGIAYYETEHYQTALHYFNKCAALKIKYMLSKKSFAYQNIAKTYVKTGKLFKAEEFFLKGITSFNQEFGEDYFRMAELLTDYGLLLESENRCTEAVNIFHRALALSIHTYGEKSPFVSLSYKYLGDYYLNQHNYDSSLMFYQKALIAIKSDYYDSDINSNPSINSSLYDIRLVDILKSKAKAFELKALSQEAPAIRIICMGKSGENIELALQLIAKIRSDYMSEDSRIYLADNEKETYIFAVEVLAKLYLLTGDTALVQKMFVITQKAKASVLRDEIADNELFNSINVPDTLQKLHTNLLLNISAYSRLVQEEKGKINPDTIKISFWKDKLFEMKRSNEKLEENIIIRFPQYRDLLYKSEPVSFKELRSKLKKDETLVEYFLSNQVKDGFRKLFIFVGTSKKLNCIELAVDTLFSINSEIIRHGTLQNQSMRDSAVNYKDYTCALFYMYENLIKPIEDQLAGNRLIIIPDEEIALLPFDAFLKSCPDTNHGNFYGLQYLIYQYTFSYGYSSSLIFNNEIHPSERSRIYAFSPYDSKASNGSFTASGYLSGATKEISAISRWFSCEKFIGDNATEANFKSVMQKNGILHLAMHTKQDSSNSDFSSLMFETRGDTLEDGQLFNYEVSLCRIKSPMVVLSACNTGTGTLSRGEGIISLTRGFILAGASSVVMTFWDVNDEVSAAIIDRFYYHLSKGSMKNDAMRSAKLEYLKTHPPFYSRPYYWAGYEVLGTNDPLVSSYHRSILILLLTLTLIAGISVFYFKWRSNFRDRS